VALAAALAQAMAQAVAKAKALPDINARRAKFCQ